MREMWFQRDQYNNNQITVNDSQLIKCQLLSRKVNHKSSEKSKAPHRVTRPQAQIVPRDLVYLYADRNKLKGRERYIVVSVDSNWCTVRKFSGVQFHKPTYKVKTQECYKIPSDFNFISSLHTSCRQLSDSENSDIDDTDKMTSAVPSSSSPALHPPPSVPAEISEPPQDTQSVITASDEPVIQEDLVDIPSSASLPTSPSTIESCQPAITPLRSSNRQCKLPAHFKDYDMST